VRYLLDTNTIGDLIRYPAGRAATRIKSLEDGSVFTSVIVAAEVRFGLVNNPSKRLAARIEEAFGAMVVEPFSPGADWHYAEIRAFLKGEGKPIGANDLFIAAHARALDATLVSDNVREFSRVPGLKLENWLR
jgi:tRNA(fMet)-specific endonuclease VapC